MGERVDEDDVKDAKSDVAAAQELYHKDKAAWAHIYEAAKDDLEFYKGGKDQWEAADLKIRQDSKRPSLTTNLLPQFVHQVVNEIRANVPMQKVLPVDDTSDLETAKIFQGGIKNIEYSSNALMVYDTGAENAVKCGLGWLRLDHDYDNVETFDEVPLQNIKLKRVVNPLSVIIDSTSVECDGCDAKHGFVLDQYSEEEFKEQWPKFEPKSFDDIDGASSDKIIVAEFFQIIKVDVEIALMPDKSIITLEKAQQLGLQPVKTKIVKRSKVKRQRLSGDAVLEETMFPGSYIPLVPVYGEEHWIDGKRHLFSLIRHGKDPQRMVNYWASLETELLQKSPQAPFMGAEGQFEGHEDDWRNPGIKMTLQYKQTDVNGQPAPAPVRLSPPPVPTGVINARQTAVQDMRDAMGIQQAGLGQRSNEVSGIAISNRVKEGDMSNMHFGDNLNRSIAHCGRIIISMWPEIYDTARIIRTLGEDDTPKAIGINGAMAPDQDRVYDLNAGRYDVAVIAGPSFTTRRQETQQMMTQLMQANPHLIGVIGDLMFKYSDVPGADVISERLKKTIPPNLLEDDKNAPQVPPQITAHIQQMQQQGQQLQAALQEATQKLNSRQMELESKERIALDNNQTSITVAAISAKNTAAIALMQDQTKHIMQRLDLLHDSLQIGAEAQQQATQQQPPGPVAPQAQ